MLTAKQLKEIREHLEKAQNPVFLYDNDADGLCSFVLLRRFLGRGKGVAVRTHPDIDAGYAKRAHELGADYVFVLDRPFLGNEFVEKLEELHIPVVWIDHHDVPLPNYSSSSLSVFNPVRNKGKSKGNEPVTALVYEIGKREEDLWVAMMGCISDHYLPGFSRKFEKIYRELWGKNIKKPFDAYYKSVIGTLARAIGAGLKDSITHVVYFQNFIIGCKTPQDMLNELESDSSFARKYKEIREKYCELLEKAKLEDHSNILFFRYGGSMSMSADLANELSYLYPTLPVIVAYAQGAMSNLSIRGKNVNRIVQSLLGEFEGSSGGGHADAVGVRLRTEDLERFRKSFEHCVISL